MNGAADWLGGGGGDVRSLMMGLLEVITQMATQLSWEESAPPPPPSRVSHTEGEILKRLERIEEKLQSTNEGVAATTAAATPAVHRTYAQVAGGAASPVPAVRSRELTIHLQAEPEATICARSNKVTIHAVNTALGKGATAVA